MTHDRSAARAEARFGLVAALGGMALALAIQVALPVGVPLYDGVIVQEPYRHLHPSGDQVGEPTSFQSMPAVVSTVSPAFVAATTESPPQIQLQAADDAFQLTPGATALKVSITPVEPPSVAPPGGAIAGNVYRITVTDQAGALLAPKPCDRCLTLVVRAPEDVQGAHLQRFAGGEWTEVPANHVATSGMYLWSATGLGDFAIVGGSGGNGEGIERIVLFGGAAVIMLLVFVAVIVLRGRNASAPAPVRDTAGRPGAAVRRSRGIPSKRKAPRRPPPGSSEP